MHVKRLVKVWVVKGRGGPTGLPLNGVGGGVIMNVIAKKYCVSMQVLNLFQDLFVSCLKVLVRVGTKGKPLMRNEYASSVNVL